VRVLLADDDTIFSNLVCNILRRNDYLVKPAMSVEEACRELDRGDYDLVMQDLCFPALQDGFAMLEKVRDQYPGKIVLMISGAGNIPEAVRSIQRGAIDFIEKPIEPDHLLARLQQLRERILMEHKLRSLERSSIGMIGESEAMQEVYSLIVKAARVDCPVLVTGETGAGKELAANAIHRLSQYSGKPLTIINCASVPRELFEAELFGYEQGAFTGAAQSRIGYIEFAKDSSFFMDEISEMPLTLQAKLLRVISAGEIQKVGGKIVPVKTRIISASNRDLQRLVEEGSFRNDLFYRLNTIHIHIPPLRERREDIPLLASAFIHEYCSRNNCQPRQLTLEASQWLCKQPWPGNARELKNTLERTMVFSTGTQIDQRDLVMDSRSDPIQTQGSAKPGLHTALKEFEKDYITHCLRANSGNLSQTARELQMDKSNLSKKLAALGIRLKDDT
jgi:DNA-binding NtrC family response regulator